jgi:integrase
MGNEAKMVTQKEDLPKYVTTYEEGGKTYYQVYVNLRSKKYPTKIRAQERILEIGTLKEAMRLRDKAIIELTQQIAEREAKGYTWGEVVAKWDIYWRRYPSRSFNDATLKDHVSRMTNWTELWWKKPAREISIGDVRTVIKAACDRGASIALRNQVKQSINTIFKWGLEEKLIPGMDRSPARDVEVLCEGESRPDEKRKEILTSGEISRLLETAERKEHPWYPVWFVGFHSGLRTSELEALRKEKVELVPVDVADQLDLLPDGDVRKSYGFLHVELAWKTKGKKYGPTKAHYYRSVPINSELYRFLISYLPKATFGKDEYGERLFDALPYWRGGNQAGILRLFCEANGLVSIKFHTIRACFATQLLGLGVPEDKVMKIGGWKDVDTMRIYVRTAGILEQGATEGLKFKGKGRHFDPASPYRNVDYRKSTELADDDDDDEGDEQVAEAAEVVAAPKEQATNVVSFAAFRREQRQ